MEMEMGGGAQTCAGLEKKEEGGGAGGVEMVVMVVANAK